MPLQKNQLLTLRIERLSSDGSGVAHSPEGEAVFVPGTAPGDEAQVRIVKDCGRYAFGILDKLLTPSPDRIPVDCAVAGPCGGCSLRHMDYAAELRSKQESVADAFRRIGGLDVPVLDALSSPEVDRYRNKVQFPVGRDKNGAPCIGFYAGRTHRIVPCPDCKLQPGVLNDIGNALCSFFAAHGIQPYDEESGKGLVRHIFLRRGTHSGQIMVCLVCTRPKFPHSEAAGPLDLGKDARQRCVLHLHGQRRFGPGVLPGGPDGLEIHRKQQHHRRKNPQHTACRATPHKEKFLHK